MRRWVLVVVGLAAGWLGGPAPARAAECAERLHADRFTERVRALQEPVALAEPGLEAELEALQQALAGGCVDEPLHRQTLAALYLADAAYTLLGGGAPGQADEALDAAALLGGPSGRDPLYGPAVGERYTAALAQPRAPSLLGVALAPTPDVLVIDGEVRYDDSPYSLPEGLHVVQWVQDGRWAGAVVVLRADQQLILGGALPAAGGPGPGAGVAPPPPPPPEGLRLGVGAALGGAAMGGLAGTGAAAAHPGVGLSARAELPLSPTVHTQLRLGGGWGAGGWSAATAGGVPSTLGWASAALGAGWAPTAGWRLELGLGVALGRARFTGLDPASYEALLCAEGGCGEPPTAEALARVPVQLGWGGPALGVGAARTLAAGPGPWALAVELDLARSPARWVAVGGVALRWSVATGWGPR